MRRFGMLLAAASSATVAVPVMAQTADATTQVIMRVDISKIGRDGSTKPDPAPQPTDGTSDPNPTPTPTPTPEPADDGEDVPVTGFVYAKYMQCSAAGLNFDCYSISDGVPYGIVSSDHCETRQPASYRKVVNALSMQIFGDTETFVPAGTTSAKTCGEVGHGWNCQDDGMQCIGLVKGSYSATLAPPEDCSKPNSDGFAPTLEAFGLKAPPYDGSCKKGIYGVLRACSFDGSDQYINAWTCFKINPDTGDVSSATGNYCSTGHDYTPEEEAQIVAAGLYPPGRADSLFGPDGKDCNEGGVTLHRTLKDYRAVQTGVPDAQGVCLGGKVVEWAYSCTGADGASLPPSACAGAVSGWDQNDRELWSNCRDSYGTVVAGAGCGYPSYGRPEFKTSEWPLSVAMDPATVTRTVTYRYPDSCPN